MNKRCWTPWRTESERVRLTNDLTFSASTRLNQESYCAWRGSDGISSGKQNSGAFKLISLALMYTVIYPNTDNDKNLLTTNTMQTEITPVILYEYNRQSNKYFWKDAKFYNKWENLWWNCCFLLAVVGLPVVSWWLMVTFTGCSRHRTDNSRVSIYWPNLAT